MGIRNLVLGTNSKNILSRRIKISRHCWFGHVLRMVSIRLSCRALFSVPPTKTKKPREGQHRTWECGMEKRTADSAKVFHIFVTGDQKIRQPVGWRHGKMCQRNVNDGDGFVVFSRIRTTKNMCACMVRRYSLCWLLGFSCPDPVGSFTVHIAYSSFPL